MKEQGNNNILNVIGKAYVNEYKTVGKKIMQKLTDLKKRFTKPESLELPEANNNGACYNQKDISESLKQSVYTPEQSYIIDKQSEGKESQNLIKDSKEII